ncbi:hypothetical protein [Pararhizobium sp. IMCC21322]|uniref:hypothetical protein n=1 Tax=Pararhizobium sp. IMCC21322 TaxID=3067903 RepID=UPI002740FC55|nr:hypothetical protein [Pararhizobium sp. IMCC21322]
MMMISPIAHASGMTAPGNPVKQIQTGCGEQCDTSIILVAKKLSVSKTIKVGPKGSQKNMTKSQLRKQNPDVYKLYNKTERAAMDYYAGGGGGVVPASCTLNPGYIHCSGFGWYCTVWTNGSGNSTCGRLPPFVPKPQ